MKSTPSPFSDLGDDQYRRRQRRHSDYPNCHAKYLLKESAHETAFYTSSRPHIVTVRDGSKGCL